MNADGPPDVRSLTELVQSFPKFLVAVEDCCKRFLEQLRSDCCWKALCAELQKAFWYYRDEIHETAMRDLPKMSERGFFSVLLEASAAFAPRYSKPIDKHKLYEEYSEYLRKRPRIGAILLDPALEKCLMVESFNSGRWTFPSGKLEVGERDVECAVREVCEEVGLDIADRIDEADYLAENIQVRDNVALVKLYVISGITIDKKIKPTSRKEIRKTAWIPLVKFPGWTVNETTGLRFFNVEDFVLGLKQWIQSRRKIPHGNMTDSTVSRIDSKIKASFTKRGFLLDASRVAAAFDSGWNQSRTSLKA